MVSLACMFAAASPANAQAKFKVGDRAEKMSAGEWVTVEIIGIKENDQYLVRFVKTGISGALYSGSELRPIQAKAQTGNPNDGGTVRNQANGNTGTNNQSSRKPANSSRFGGRDPRTCDSTKAPAQGAITAALAQKYLNCQMEGILRGTLYLVENVKVTVGGGVPFTPNLGSFDSINVRIPLYPIRGSLVRYSCVDLIRSHVGPPDTNCTAYNEAKATGYCYKTTLGDWKCSMADRAANEIENVRERVVPPK